MVTLEDIKKEEAGYTSEKYCSEANETPRYKIAQIHASRDAFMYAANWRINVAWHPITQVPERNKVYVAQIGEDAFDTFYDSENWESFSKGLNFVRWAYMEDLIPVNK